MSLNIIVACDLNFGIGFKNTLPWYIPEDLKNFKNTTTNHTVIMGRKTFESLNFRPLPNRKNIVVTQDKNLSSNNPNLIFLDINNTREFIKQNRNNETIFIIGGENLYNEFLDECDNIYLTKIYERFECDKKFKFNEDKFKEEWSSGIFISKSNNLKFKYYKLKNKLDE